MSLRTNRRALGALAAAAAVWTVMQPAPAVAGVHGDNLSRCLVQSTTPADRVAFVRWMFMALSKHPEVADLVTVTEAQRIEASRTAAQLVQRLVLTDCRPLAAEALRHEGMESVTAGFEMFGEAAAADLMTQPAVAAQFDNLGTYIDQAAWDKFAREVER